MVQIIRNEDGTTTYRDDCPIGQPERISDSSQVAGSVSDDENQDWMLETGLWVKSKTTGRLYAPKHIPDSDIDCIIVDGVWFERSE